jgi:hypothetical protein
VKEEEKGQGTNKERRKEERLLFKKKIVYVGFVYMLAYISHAEQFFNFCLSAESIPGLKCPNKLAILCNSFRCAKKVELFLSKPKPGPYRPSEKVKKQITTCDI